MAMELLIYWREDYQVSYLKGDIVQVEDDGYWTIYHDFNRNAFRVVNVIKDNKDEKLEQYILESDGKIKHKRKYQVTVDLPDQITYVDDLQDLNINEKT